MADRRDRHNLGNSRLWLWGAAAAAVILGVVYYFGSVATQPSLVSGEGADLTTPEEVEAEVLDGEAAGSAEPGQ
jgi:hypothetical protein